MSETAPIIPGFERQEWPAASVDGPAALLVHGIAARPRQLEGLAHGLAGAGFRVVAPLLRGHGTRYTDLNDVTWHDWYDGIESEYRLLKQSHSQVVVIGFSLGASLVLELAANHPVDVLVLLCTPLRSFFTFIPNRPAIRLLERLTRTVPTFAKRAPRSQPHLERGVYRRIPVSSLKTIDALHRRIRTRLGRVCAPTLIVHATRDFTARRVGGMILARDLGSTDKRIVWVNTRNHEVTRCEKRAFVIETVVAFAARQLLPEGEAG